MYSALLRLAAGKNLKGKAMDRKWYEDGNGVRGNTWDGVYSLWGSYAVAEGEVHRLASEGSLAKEGPFAMRTLDGRVGCVAETVAVCRLDRGINKWNINGEKVNLRFISAVCCL